MFPEVVGHLVSGQLVALGGQEGGKVAEGRAAGPSFINYVAELGGQLADSADRAGPGGVGGFKRLEAGK